MAIPCLGDSERIAGPGVGQVESLTSSWYPAAAGPSSPSCDTLLLPFELLAVAVSSPSSSDIAPLKYGSTTGSTVCPVPRTLFQNKHSRFCAAQGVQNCAGDTKECVQEGPVWPTKFCAAQGAGNRARSAGTRHGRSQHQATPRSPGQPAAHSEFAAMDVIGGNHGGGGVLFCLLLQTADCRIFSHSSRGTARVSRTRRSGCPSGSGPAPRPPVARSLSPGPDMDRAQIPEC